MGRRRHSKHSQKRQNQRLKRRGGCPEPSQPLRGAHGSDPECGVREGVTDSPLWNSLDEQSLAGLSPPPSLSALVAADYVYKSGLSSDEMEVTRKLSCLNFSVLPCSCDTLVMSHGAAEHGHSHHHSHEQLRQDGVHVSLPAAESSRAHVVNTADMSDVEPYSELPSATQLDVLLPTLDHRDIEDGRRLEAMDCEQRRRRKRTSRKKPNRRTKKMRLHVHHHSETSMTASKQAVQPLTSSFVSQSFVTDGKEMGNAAGHLRRTRSFKRSKRQPRPEDTDPMLCILSDTSAMCEVDVDKGMNGDGADNDFFNATPPAEEITPIGMIMEGLGSMGGPTVSLEELPNESDLTETTSDRYVVLV